MKAALNLEGKHYFDHHAWSDIAIEKSTLKDERLDKRFKSLLGRMWAGIGESIPFACPDWANVSDPRTTSFKRLLSM